MRPIRLQNVSVSGFIPKVGNRMYLTCWILVGVILSIAAGWLQVVEPFVGPGLIILLLISPLVLMSSTEVKVSLLLAALILSRPMQVIGLPALVNYVHFLVLIALLCEMVFIRPVTRKLSKTIFSMSVIFGIVVVASGLIEQWYGLRPFIFWLTFVIPFIVFVACLELNDLQLNVVRNVALALGLVQIPFALYQSQVLGLVHDGVQGTLIGQGAGAHILGMVGVLAAVLIWWAYPNVGIHIRIGLVLLFLMLGVLGDAKQIYPAVLLGSIPLLLYMFRRRPHLIPVIVGLVFTLVPIIFVLNPSFRNIANLDHILWLVEIKIDQIQIVGEELTTMRFLMGSGPGNGTSKIALLSLPGYGNVPESVLGSGMSEVALRLLDANKDFFGVNMGSSVASPFNSWLGIFTDVGIIGLVVYCILGALVLRCITKSTDQVKAVVRSLMLMAVILGLIYSWLDEPVYSVYLSVTIVCVVRFAAPVSFKR